MFACWKPQAAARRKLKEALVIEAGEWIDRLHVEVVF
jgi:hypothetical protein